MARSVAVLTLLAVCVILVEGHGWWGGSRRRGRQCPSKDENEDHVCCEKKTVTYKITWEQCARCRGSPYETGEKCYNIWGREKCVHRYVEYVTKVYCEYKCCEGWKQDNYGYCSIKEDSSDDYQKDDIVCENGGTAYDGRCSCPTGFQGTRCETPVCTPECLNNGVCTGRDGKAVCACPEGKFTGSRCETPICSPSCQNGGTCVIGAYSAKCICPNGYEGQSCEKVVKDGICPATPSDARYPYYCSCDSDCSGVQKCCRNGNGAYECRMPAKDTCTHNGMEYQIGHTIRNNSCTTCVCKDPNSGNGWECTTISCPRLSCSRTVTVPGVCCPICEYIPTSTTPPPPTQRPSCVDQETGMKYAVGQTVYFDNGCRPCTCEYLSQSGSTSWSCMVIDCAPLTGCQNQRRIQNQCCPVCDDIPTTTTPAPHPTCEYNGRRYPVGYTRNNTCGSCVCAEMGGIYEWTCRHTDCPRLSCENQVTPQGQCCPVCPDVQCGPICDMWCPNGFVEDKNGCPICQCKPNKDCGPICKMWCQNGFVEDEYGCPICQCKTTSTSGPPPTTPPPMCRYNGQLYPHMSERAEACQKCTCRFQYGGYLDWTCERFPCQPTDCINPIREAGQCCPTCPATTSTTTTTMAPSSGPRFNNCPNEKIVIHTNSAAYIAVHETLKLTAHDSSGRTYNVTYSKTIIMAAQCSCSANIHIITAQSTPDRYGRFATCSFTVHIVDNHPPVYNSCPSTITAYEEDVVSWSEPEVVDNVGIKSKKFISDYPNNSKFKEGAHVLMYVATDHEGNVGVCKFLVSVYKKGTSDPTVPNELKRESQDEARKRIILPVVGALAALILLTIIILLALCRRVARKRNARQATSTDGHAYDNNIYAVPNTPPPSYRSSPAIKMKLPPTYEEKEKKPPLYDEISVQVFGKKAGIDNPIYESNDDLDVGQINLKLQLKDDADA